MGIKLVNINSEIGAGTRGSSLGIAAVKIASINARSDYFKKYPSVLVQDNNHLLFEEITTPYAKYIEGIREVYERQAEAVRKTIEAGDFPVVLSADHASAGGTIAGVKTARPEKRLGVVWIDAHADLHSPYSSPSGNVHGMPLGCSLGNDNNDRKINDVSEKAAEEWEKMKNTGGICPKILPEDVVFFGVRDTEEPERHQMEKQNIRNYTVEELRYRGMKTCMDEALGRLKNCDHIYVTFDVDSLDCDLISKGTGTPVSKGFDQKEAIGIIKSIIESGKLSCFEMVEINPTLDEKQNKMAETAFEVLETVTPLIEQQLK